MQGLRHQHRLQLAALALLISAAAALPGGAAAADHGPWLLTRLPELGTLRWSCDPAERGYRIYELRLDATRAKATETVTAATGGRLVLYRRIQPGAKVVFPRSTAAGWKITLSQFTEPGTLRAFVTVNFKPGGPSGHCAAYLPPAFTVRVVPR